MGPPGLWLRCLPRAFPPALGSRAPEGAGSGLCAGVGSVPCPLPFCPQMSPPGICLPLTVPLVPSVRFLWAAHPQRDLQDRRQPPGGGGPGGAPRPQQEPPVPQQAPLPEDRGAQGLGEGGTAIHRALSGNRYCEPLGSPGCFPLGAGSQGSLRAESQHPGFTLLGGTEVSG